MRSWMKFRLHKGPARARISDDSCMRLPWYAWRSSLTARPPRPSFRGNGDWPGIRIWVSWTSRRCQIQILQRPLFASSVLTSIHSGPTSMLEEVKRSRRPKMRRPRPSETRRKLKRLLGALTDARYLHKECGTRREFLTKNAFGMLRIACGIVVCRKAPIYIFFGLGFDLFACCNETQTTQ